MSEPAKAMTEAHEAIADATALALISKAELDQQITTARAYPRSLKRFVSECLDMATLREDIAAECFYVLPRAGKHIEGPSVRLAEIVASAWGNCRAAQRIVDEGKDFITAQGIFHDLERNVAITCEVRRRITDKEGRRFNVDMIGVTGNAASSIALRNAVFKGVPKAFWNEIYLTCRRVAVGDVKTLASKRAEALAYVAKHGVKAELVFAALGVKGEQDIGIEELATLRGLINSVKDGETTIERAFAPRETSAPQPKVETIAPRPIRKVRPRAEPTRDDAVTLRELIDQVGAPYNDVLARYGVASLAALTQDQLTDAFAWVRGMRAE